MNRWACIENTLITHIPVAPPVLGRNNQEERFSSAAASDDGILGWPRWGRQGAANLEGDCANRLSSCQPTLYERPTYSWVDSKPYCAFCPRSPQARSVALPHLVPADLSFTGSRPHDLLGL